MHHRDEEQTHCDAPHRSTQTQTNTHTHTHTHKLCHDCGPRQELHTFLDGTWRLEQREQPADETALALVAGQQTPEAVLDRLHRRWPVEPQEEPGIELERNMGNV